MGSKYGSSRVKLDNGLVFDSKREYARYLELMALQSDGTIRNLRMQVPFELVPAQKLPQPYEITCKNGKIRHVNTLKAVKYYADFVYELDGNIVVEDTKGFRTKDYTIKKKLMLEKYGIQIQEI